MKHPSMRKIAELAGVSVAAVSYAINNKPGVCAETRQRILQIMEEEQYSMPHNEKFLYLVIDDLSCFSNMFYASILDTIATAASKYGYDVAVCNQAVSFHTTTAAAAVRRGLAAGVIFFHDIAADTASFLTGYDIPFIVIDSHCKSADTAQVGVDYEIAVFSATQHLVDLGHKRLAFIGQREIPDFYAASLGGFYRAMSQAGLTVKPTWIKDEACDFDSAYRCMDEILQANRLPTGIVCATDQFALGAMHCVQDRGFSIPKDFSFVGVDDLPVSQIYHPPLTTVHIDVGELAEQAVEYLHETICGEKTSAIRTICSDNLIVRASTAAQKAVIL